MSTQTSNKKRSTSWAPPSSLSTRIENEISGFVSDEDLTEETELEGEQPLRGHTSLRSSRRVSGRHLSIVSRRKLLEDQAELDSDIFDESLGCPLGSYKDATLALVGNKALQCWRLARYGLPVPPAFVLPTYVYSLHIKKAGIVDLVDEVFCGSNLRDESVREEIGGKLEKIRDAIMLTPLDQEVVANLSTFMVSLEANEMTNKGKLADFAIRSSGTAEDLASQSFAGQYDTFLYKNTVKTVEESIKACWSSMFKDHVLDYISRACFLAVGESSKESDTPEVLDIDMKPPEMGVLVMKMIDAKISGVCFSQNLWGAKNEVMVEAVLGQGEGLVSGEITPDRYVYDKNSIKLCYQELNKPTHKFVRSNNKDGVEKIELDDSIVECPILNSSQLRAITMMAKQVEEYYHRPQDIEWCIDDSGALHLLQSRPITTVDSGALSFLPPGEGFWSYDPTHFPRPLTPHMQDVYSFEYGYENGRRTGSLIKEVNFRFVHGYAYNQCVFQPPSDALERAAEAYWSKKLYEEDYREFTDFFRPDCEALQDEIRAVNPSALSHRELVEHIAKCYDSATEFWKRHHTYSFSAMTIVGDFMNRMAALTGKDEMETLTLLESASPESRGLLNREDPLLDKMYNLLADSQEAMTLLKSDKSKASWALDCLFHMPGELGEVMRQIRVEYGWRLAGGYDLVTKAIIETPDFFLETLYSGTQEDPDAGRKAVENARKVADKWKSVLPTDKHDEFEEILSVGRNFFRMRDERGLATDLTGVGLCRRGILEGGRRLVEQGVIFEPEHLCVARKHEAIALLRGDLSLLSDQKGVQVGPVSVPTPRELERRFEYIFSADPSLIPRALGVPPPQPDPMALPPNIRRTMGAVDSGLLRGIWAEAEQDEEITNNPNIVKGLSASVGVVEGPCRLVVNDSDLQKVKKGDIVVTYSCSASFNIVIGLCAGICTDYGGMLSHAAIVAREYGIPAVVGTQNSTQKFKDGDIVSVDCSSSTVRLVDSTTKDQDLKKHPLTAIRSVAPSVLQQ